MGYGTVNGLGYRMGASANESVGSCVTVPHRSPLRHINERVQGKMVEVRGLCTHASGRKFGEQV
jgi:isopropylmalate/homocitrate/citramalate synthase